MQETHSSIKDEKIWKDDFKGDLFFSHGKTNSYGLAIGCYGIFQLKHDDNRRLLVIEVKIENTIFLLINIYNANTETEQLQTLSNPSNILKTFDDIHNKSIIFGG